MGANNRVLILTLGGPDKLYSVLAAQNKVPTLVTEQLLTNDYFYCA
jgi:hypothetical protein